MIPLRSDPLTANLQTGRIPTRDDISNFQFRVNCCSRYLLVSQDIGNSETIRFSCQPHRQVERHLER